MAKPKKRYRLAVDTERCKACGLCVAYCPRAVLQLNRDRINGKGYPFMEVAVPDACIGCQSCVLVCPDCVIEIFEIPPEEDDRS